jgi:hypothetical protein
MVVLVNKECLCRKAACKLPGDGFHGLDFDPSVLKNIAAKG